MVETKSAHDVGQECLCVSNHVPKPMELHHHHIVPLYAGGGDEESNMAWLCPTAHANIHELLRAWEAANGEPSWDIRKNFSPYARNLAQRGWEER